MAHILLHFYFFSERGDLRDGWLAHCWAEQAMLHCVCRQLTLLSSKQVSRAVAYAGQKGCAACTAWQK